MQLVSACSACGLKVNATLESRESGIADARLLQGLRRDSVRLMKRAIKLNSHDLIDMVIVF